VRVLVIEDDLEFRTFLQVHLDLHDEIDEVIAADNGDDAVRLAHEVRPDAVVVDFHLGDMTGEEIARRIRGGNHDVRIIGFSGSTERLDWADQVIRKGGRSNLEELSAAISAAISEVSIQTATNGSPEARSL